MASLKICISDSCNSKYFLLKLLSGFICFNQNPHRNIQKIRKLSSYTNTLFWEFTDTPLYLNTNLLSMEKMAG